NVATFLFIRQILSVELLVGSSLQNSGEFDDLEVVAWSPDSGRVAFTGKNDEFGSDSKEQVYILDVDEINTNLQSFYPGEQEHQIVAIHGLSWSPNGRYLAYRINSRASSIKSSDSSQALEGFQVFDFESNSIVISCATKVKLLTTATNSFLWSPDSSMLAFSTTDKSQENYFTTPINVINIRDGFISILESDGELIGWVNLE
ncbi:MAG: hypothetical protein GY805_28020, partial [Chloroflexi bacterium]|nr:hypothetical protein [Chloroflexota bacterium]